MRPPLHSGQVFRRLVDRPLGADRSWRCATPLPGAALGGLLLGLVPTRLSMILSGVILLVSAPETFLHRH